MSIRMKMSLADPNKVAQAAMAALSRLQDYPQEAQVMGATTMFLRICERFDLRPTEAMQFTSNLLAHRADHLPEFRAIREYLAKEFKG
jgi:hypothetical protein